jgi:hypothetical protein
MKTASILRRFSPAAAMLAAEICLACMVSLTLSTPAAAQFWDYPFWGRRQAPQMQRQMPPWGGWQSAPERPVDASRAPPPRKQESAPAKTVVVTGDSMADWLGFGLEDAFAETPEMGVSRKFRTYSGLIRAESRKEFDWPQGAKEMLATEKPDFIIMMIGLSDRQAIRERERPRAAPKPQPAPQSKLEPTQINPAAQQPDAQEGAQGTEPQKSTEPAKSAEPQKPAAAEPAGPLMTYEFRSEKWGEAYGRRIDEMIAVLKSKGVPVLWVGLPPIRGPRGSADVAYLNELYRGHAEKAGIIYVDVWDGFVDESGNFASRGPDFEGQIRVLRAGDGVHFTKAGARKLAHYVEREIRHVMLSRGAPIALPAPEEPQPDAARPGTPAARPVAGPVVPLTTGTNAPEGLLGASAQRPGVADPSANRVLVKGEPLLSITGRADDFAWPRSDSNLGPEPEPSPPSAAPAPPAKPGTASQAPGAKPAAPAPAKKPVRGAATADEGRRPLTLSNDPLRGEPVRRRTPDNALRPPANVPTGGW